MIAGVAYDVIVVGAGSMGMSAGYHLALSGVRTLLLDAYDPPHGEGSHHGEPRLIRHAYSGGSTYIKMALRAQQLWQQLEEESGAKLFAASGVINAASADSFKFPSRLKDARSFGVAVETLDAAEICRRWPGFRLPEHYTGMYEPDAGYLFSEQCVAALRKLAVDAGAELLTYTPVNRIEVRQGGVAVHTKNGIYYAQHAILSAGAWFRTLEPFITLPVRSVRKAIGWFNPLVPLYEAGSFPGFTLADAGGTYYGFPSIGGAGLKIGRHDTGHDWTAGEALEPFGRYAEDEGDLRAALENYMPQAAGVLNKGAVCKYELTPDDDFIIDRHPLHPNVLLAGGFSGHGFKFSSVVGEILTELILYGRSSLNLEPFALSRFGAGACVPQPI
ncbi:N-methyl-L-tryptophan oxidase [Paenibacillus lutrae]|uniref:N-methyl-L-tryptophan oxidase n=1 Tax=Paenibacillus lutrae TaxID=2078573 RepID=A0A7X3FMG1_9BACL|nr:N-methyl-L-tryptophan oxidase [Paenibacillus lutrae]MVP02441.1 N-methyl-L-tryptophan oxidase [Paenibacillus lutrae]